MLDAGMDDHLAKPLQVAELAEVLARPAPSRRGSVARKRRSRDRRRLAGGRESRATAADPGRRGDRRGSRSSATRGSWSGSCSVFLADAAARVAEVDEAIADHDVQRLHAALDGLEGICDRVGAAALGRRARAIQDELRRREGLGADPFSPALGPSGLEPLLDATRIQVEERLRDQSEPHG